jgi:hypothetical protein
MHCGVRRITQRREGGEGALRINRRTPSLLVRCHGRQIGQVLVEPRKTNRSSIGGDVIQSKVGASENGVTCMA